MARKLGTEELLYIATSAPTTEADHGDAAYSKIGYLISADLSVEGDAIIARDKDAGAFGYPLAGNKSATMNITFNREMVGDTAQDAIETAALSNTLTDQTVWFNLTTTTASDKGRWGTGVVTSFAITSSNDEVAEGSATIALSNTYTVHTEA